jgi:hypothetical protein
MRLHLAPIVQAGPEQIRRHLELSSAMPSTFLELAEPTGTRAARLQACCCDLLRSRRRLGTEEGEANR